jgi:hypothetical protein
LRGDAGVGQPTKTGNVEDHFDEHGQPDRKPKVPGYARVNRSVDLRRRFLRSSG